MIRFIENHLVLRKLSSAREPAAVGGAHDPHLILPQSVLVNAAMRLLEPGVVRGRLHAVLDQFSGEGLPPGRGPTGRNLSPARPGTGRLGCIL